MKQILERMGWRFRGTCGCDGGGEEFEKTGKRYFVRTFLKHNRFHVVDLDMIVKSGHGYEIEQKVSEYEATH